MSLKVEGFSLLNAKSSKICLTYGVIPAFNGGSGPGLREDGEIP
jgi:hypothetical protein